MTIFAHRLIRPSRQPDSRTPSPDYGGMGKAIGRGLTSRLSRTKDLRAVGCMPTCIAKKAIRAMRSTGMFGRGSPFAESRSMRNGSAS